MQTLYIYSGIYFGIGFLYALWLWLFRAAKFSSIISNTLLGLPYILFTFYLGVTNKPKSIYRLFKENPKKAIIFDLDGTIIDSDASWHQALEDIATQVGLNEVTTEYLGGMNILDKWNIILDTPGVKTPFRASDLAQRTKERFLELYEAPIFIDGFWDFIRYLKGNNYKIGLASNTDKGIVERMLKRMDAEELFDFVITGNEVKNRKPNPEIYKRALKGLGVSVKETLVFEDSYLGAQASVSAKIDTVVIWNEDIPKQLYSVNPAYFVNDYVDFMERIAKSPKERSEEALDILVAQEEEISLEVKNA